MRIPLRLVFPILVVIATLTVCSLGVRAELKTREVNPVECCSHLWNETVALH